MPLPLTFNFRLGLIGYPLSHSLSPKIHSAALDACGLQGDYSLFPIPPDEVQGLKDLLSRVRSGEIHGLNVTIPHKQNVIPFLDELTPTARVIGAVNTIYLRDNKLVGDNTDAPGFLSDLQRFLAERGSPIADRRWLMANRRSQVADRKPQIANRKSAVVLGAGGAARAVVYALLNDGWEVTIAARRLEQAEQLARSFPNYQLQITDYQSFILQPLSFILLVNTTPVGMTPNVDQSPWPEKFHFPAHAVIYDLVYNPRETKLVREACLQGLAATTGLGMLIEQAALAFEIWTGHQPPRELMLEAVEQTAH